MSSVFEFTVFVKVSSEHMNDQVKSYSQVGNSKLMQTGFVFFRNIVDSN